MARIALKFNPGAQGDAELMRSFVIRHREFDKVVDSLNDPDSLPLILITGQRGSGKTTLVRYVAAHVRASEYLGLNWYPIVFAEEAYEVSTAGEFWLECLFRIKEDFKDTDWKDQYESLRSEPDENLLESKAFQGVQRFASYLGKNLLLVVENLQVLLAQQLSAEASDKILRRIYESKNIKLLATATRIDELEAFKVASAESFQAVELHPLTLSEIRTFWGSLSSVKVTPRQARPLQILTGGNPRLLLILSEFVRKNSLRALTDNVVRLVDEHTEYFRSRLESLPPLERKIFVALLELWEPSTARAISDFARVEITKTSSLLNRLISRDMASHAKGRGRRLFQASERLYNIYYLLRRRGSEPDSRIRLAVRFMVQFYEGERLVERIARIAGEACSLDPQFRNEHYFAYKELAGALDQEQRQRLFESTDDEFLRSAPRELLDVVENQRKKDHWRDHIKLLNEGEKIRQAKKPTNAIEILRKAIALFPSHGHAHAHLGAAYEDAGLTKEAEESYLRAVECDDKDYWAWLKYARFLYHSKRPGKAKSIVMRLLAADDLKPASLRFLSGLCHDVGMYREAQTTAERIIASTQDEDTIMSAWSSLAELRHYHLNEPEIAVEAYETILKGRPQQYWTRIQFGELMRDVLLKPTQAEEQFRLAEDTLRKLIDRDDAPPRIVIDLAQLLTDLERNNEAIEFLDKAIAMVGDDPNSLRKIARLLVRLKRYSEAEANYLKAVKAANRPSFLCSLYEDLGDLYRVHLHNTRASEAAYRNAIREEPGSAAAYLGCGWLLEANGRKKESRQMYLEAIKIEGIFSRAWPYYLSLRLELGEPVKQIIDECDQFITQRRRAKALLAKIARIFSRDRRAEALRYAEILARESLDPTAPDNWERVYTLAQILSAEGMWKEAVALSPVFVRETLNSTQAVNKATAFLMNASANGFAADALDVIDQSAAGGALEPLRTGILLFLGKDITTPQEIMEVAQDVEQGIKDIQTKQAVTA